MARSILSVTPGKEQGEIIEKDTEDIILFFLASGISQVRIEASNLMHMYFVFNAAEIKELEALYFSGEKLPLDFREVMKARDKWKDALSMLRNIRESARSQKKAEIAIADTAPVAVAAPAEG